MSLWGDAANYYSSSLSLWFIFFTSICCCCCPVVKCWLAIFDQSSVEMECIRWDCRLWMLMETQRITFLLCLLLAKGWSTDDGLPIRRKLYLSCRQPKLNGATHYFNNNIKTQQINKQNEIQTGLWTHRLRRASIRTTRGWCWWWLEPPLLRL